MAKGSQYERDICRLLSEWWSNGERDDCFWRTSNSGGRATTRKQKGKDTKGQHGDMTATDSHGKPFLDAFTIEMKNGYPRANALDMVDRLETAALLPYEKWIYKVTRDTQHAGSKSWWLIHHKPRKESLVWMPWVAYKALQHLQKEEKLQASPFPFVRIQTQIRILNLGPDGRYISRSVHVMGTRLSELLKWLHPDCIAALNMGQQGPLYNLL